MPTLRELLKLLYRQTEGFGRSLAAMLGIDVAIPDYSSLAKRAGKLEIALGVAQKPGSIDVVVDSTGVKVFGEGEWKTRTRGKSKRQTWLKLHLPVDPDAREIVAEVLTENSSHDADAVLDLLKQVEQPAGKFYGDGAYDKWKAYEELESRNIQPVIPPSTQRQDQTTWQRLRGPAAPGRGDSGHPSHESQSLEAGSGISSQKPRRNDHVPHETDVWKLPEKPHPRQSTNRSPLTLQNHESIHPDRVAAIRVELVNKANSQSECTSG